MITMPLIGARAAECCGCYCYPAQYNVEQPPCLCLAAEKALRMISAGRLDTPLSPEERQECFAEIDKVEGYSSQGMEQDTDAQVASTVLSAWTDYARDKGLL